MYYIVSELLLLHKYIFQKYNFLLLVSSSPNEFSKIMVVVLTVLSLVASIFQPILHLHSSNKQKLKYKYTIY